MLINIYCREIVYDKCNVQNSVVIESKQLIEFSESLPDGFYATVQKKVVTMEVTRKKEGSSAGNYIHNTEIYSRVMCLLSVGHVSLEDLFFYELSPVPMSMFRVTAEERFPKKKVALKNKVKFEVSKINSTIDLIIVDGRAALYHIHWPKYPKVRDFVDSFVLYISELLQFVVVYLIFGRYRDYSI